MIILWYVESNAMDEAGQRLRELVQCGALGYGPDKYKELEETLVPLFDNISEALKGPGHGGHGPGAGGGSGDA